MIPNSYVQKQGIDFNKVFAPVTRIETLRLLLAFEAKNSWEVDHFDVKSAFLNGDLQEDVYVTQPEGFVKHGKEHLVYKMIKALWTLSGTTSLVCKIKQVFRNPGFHTMSIQACTIYKA